ncbi:GntR family transcriptional regulator [Raineyella sp. LH-20]|uniref:GntR family transcriptional regulator n=1 Tax=Raineyella sp. LH-20 TaxID=3081204 RepID=UPI002954A6A4|nr:GntR family transcriptional regulator [Raineyella sp. LH-20]WOP18244.1 GntR family transcriptional regulator [Raineyella sp. LH-20]
MRIVLSETTGIPLYEQIVEQLRQQIVTGRLAAGEPLPSLRSLAKDLRVSLITTTRAYNELAAADLIVNVPGKGSYVATVDPSAARRQVVEAARADLAQAVATARGSGLVALPELVEILEEEWNR